MLGLAYKDSSIFKVLGHMTNVQRNRSLCFPNKECWRQNYWLPNITRHGVILLKTEKMWNPSDYLFSLSTSLPDKFVSCFSQHQTPTAVAGKSSRFVHTLVMIQKHFRSPPCVVFLSYSLKQPDFLSGKRCCCRCFKESVIKVNYDYI